MDLSRIILAARGRVPADLLFVNGRVVDVLAGRIRNAPVAVSQGRIVGFGASSAETVIDLKGRFLCPGFVDAHVHIESAMTWVPEFVAAVLPRGTVTVVADPHEIANVLGADGIRYMLECSRRRPMNLYYMLPSCVPATDMETSGAALDAAALAPFYADPLVIGLGEMMNYPGVLAADPAVLDKIAAARERGLPVDGHCPGLSGQDLWAYAAAGMGSDHECATAEEAREKIEAGMHIMIREGSGAKNLKDLAPLVNERNHHRFMWCTDDRHPHDLMAGGHIDELIRRGIQGGLDPMIALRMATCHPARYFNLAFHGAIAPGMRADLTVFQDIQAPRAEMVFHNGVKVAENGRLIAENRAPEGLAPKSPMRLDPERVDFSIKVRPGRIRVIRLVPDQLLTRGQWAEPSVTDGRVVSDPDRDILKIAVVERYSGKAGIGIGFVSGFGLKRGAIASSVAHDSHNIIVAGVTDGAMRAALRAVVSGGGGLAVVSGDGPDGEGKVSALALPVAGLMSLEPVDAVRRRLEELNAAAHALGCQLADPFMTLSFLALPVIPDLKITDKGLVDVGRFQVTPLFEGAPP